MTDVYIRGDENLGRRKIMRRRQRKTDFYKPMRESLRKTQPC